ncbi:MAG TPA: serine/threonine-protein kinase [Bryobacteraceae bacterium]|jgi:serine/threonine-protein kinase|nr:serine/threonine-protein kinase [Bryobacteraceae bacterium]
MTGAQLDHYRILEKLGEGGMGVVYKALDLNLDRVVALKLLSSDLAAYPELTERFKCEARLQATLNHPNIALLYTFFFWEGSPVMVMEFIEGQTFQCMVRERGPVPAGALVPLFKQALMGVGAAHRHGIVHRDIKPANIMLSRSGLVKVMDFGIAKAIGAGSGLTRTNTAMGTSWYMSPEQVLNHPVDARSDIYALGVTLYEMLSGEVPFRASSEFEIQRAHVHSMPTPPSVHNPQIPAHLVAAVLRALEKNPDARFQSVEEFGTALGAIAPPMAHSPTPVPEHRTPLPSPAPPILPGQQRVAVPISKTPPPLPPAVPVSTKPSARPQPRRRSKAPVVIAAILLAMLALGGFLYVNAASQERERARAEALLEEQEAERHRQATAEQEREKQQAAEDARNTEALREQIQQEEEARNGSHGASPSTAPNKPARSPAPGNDQESALSNALEGADRGGMSQGQTRPSAIGSLTGLWRGTYMCLQQGQNRAEISLVGNAAGAVSALMLFQVPNAQPGSYFMRGMFDQSTGQINLHFTKWVSHPLNYVPANLTGVVDLRQGVMRGQVIAPGCGNFEVWRNR